LAVPEKFAGRRVKCPGCQSLIEIPAVAGVEITPVASPVRAKAAAGTTGTKPGPPPLPHVVKAAAPAGASCPDCGVRLEADAFECVECGWMAEMEVDAHGGDKGKGSQKCGRCYVQIRRDNIDLNQSVEKHMKKLIETEQLWLRITHREPDPSEEPRPNDLIIKGKITKCNYGNRAMRYLLTLVAMFGPGSCQLDAEVEVDTATHGKRRFRAGARQSMGFLGGKDEILMEANVRIVGRKIANSAARHFTGRSLLNAHAYVCGWWSLGLGVPALLPYCGIFFGLPGLALGGISLMTILQRKLPRGHIVAIIGLVCPFMGLAFTVMFYLYQFMRRF